MKKLIAASAIILAMVIFKDWVFAFLVVAWIYFKMAIGV